MIFFWHPGLLAEEVFAIAEKDLQLIRTKERHQVTSPSAK